eukprot:Pgem_evm2s3977
MKGIFASKTPKDVHRYNSSERTIQTACKMTRSILHTSGMKRNQWKRAMINAAFIHNRIPKNDRQTCSE